MRRFVAVSLLIASLASTTAKADAPNEKPPPMRFPPKSPEESLAEIVVHPGFHVELVAAEPLVRSPIAMDFDEDERMWVVEYPEYNDHAATVPHGRGRIRVLEDRDFDGR